MLLHAGIGNWIAYLAAYDERRQIPDLNPAGARALKKRLVRAGRLDDLLVLSLSATATEKKSAVRQGADLVAAGVQVGDHPG
jgi:hypothetical protein